MKQLSQATIIGLPQPKTWDEYERGCLETFGGGHRRNPEKYAAYQHGMSTVFNLLRGEFPTAERCQSAPAMYSALEKVAAWMTNVNAYEASEVFADVLAALKAAGMSEADLDTLAVSALRGAASIHGTRKPTGESEGER